VTRLNLPIVVMGMLISLCLLASQVACDRDKDQRDRDSAADAPGQRRGIDPRRSKQDIANRTRGTASPASSDRLQLDGIRLKLPSDWPSRTRSGGSGPGPHKRVTYELRKALETTESCTAVIAHLPDMKGKDQANIDHWIEMFAQPDGRPSSEVAKLETMNVGEIEIKLLVISGTMTGRPERTRAADTAPREDYRMIAAIINHPKGPHLFKLTGPAKAVAPWEESVRSLLSSAQITANDRQQRSEGNAEAESP